LQPDAAQEPKQAVVDYYVTGLVLVQIGLFLFLPASQGFTSLLTTAGLLLILEAAHLLGILSNVLSVFMFDHAVNYQWRTSRTVVLLALNYLDVALAFVVLQRIIGVGLPESHIQQLYNSVAIMATVGGATGGRVASLLALLQIPISLAIVGVGLAAVVSLATAQTPNSEQLPS